MNRRTDREEHSHEQSARAETDAPIEAQENSTTPRDTTKARTALEGFRPAGRPRLDGRRGKLGRSPRRQVRLPEELDAALTAYAVKHGVSPSEVIRQALARFLSEQNNASPSEGTAEQSHPDTTQLRPQSPKVKRTWRQRQEGAMIAVKASKRTGDILPRRIYQLAGVSVPDNATDHTQRAEDLK